MYIETEAGFSVPTKKGVDVYVASQVPFQDRLQICRALSLPQSSVRVIAIDPGGAFGGKEEITVQIHLTLLAMKTKKPVKMSWTREESGISATTRHPMDIELKTGFRKDGTLLANDARLIADTGAYMSYGPTVIEVAAGAVNGPYRIPHTHVEALSVYTNNPPAGAMRGFGVAQVNFAMETQLDIAAEKLGLDPIELRKINALREGEPDGTGYVPITKSRFMETLETAQKVNLWESRVIYRGRGERPWLFRGVGFAAGMKSMGYGAFPEQVMVKVQLTREGGYRVYVSNPEMGSGTSTALRQIAAQALNTSVSRIRTCPARHEVRCRLRRVRCLKGCLRYRQRNNQSLSQTETKAVEGSVATSEDESGFAQIELRSRGWPREAIKPPRLGSDENSDGHCLVFRPQAV